MFAGRGAPPRNPPPGGFNGPPNFNGQNWGPPGITWFILKITLLITKFFIQGGPSNMMGGPGSNGPPFGPPNMMGAPPNINSAPPPLIGGPNNPNTGNNQSNFPGSGAPPNLVLLFYYVIFLGFYNSFFLLRVWI